VGTTRSSASRPFLLLLALLGLPVAARDLPTQEPIPAPRDRDYPGVIALSVDLRDTPQRIFHVHESIPVQPGPLVLLYPLWIPGEHGPTGTLESVTGLELRAGAQVLPWRRDLTELAALHVNVPAGVARLELQFDLLSPTQNEQNFGASVSVTQNIVDLEWNQVLFYPAGYYARRVRFEPAVQLPPGWSFASALQRAAAAGGVAHFAPVDLETLIDSPLISGQYFRRVALTPAGAAAPVWLDIVADRAANLEANEAQLRQHAALVVQATRLFDSEHYQHYDFLLTLSDVTGHFGLEHHQSSDDRARADHFIDPADYRVEASLLPHEYVHSWNGKFRRPNGLIVPNYNEPMRDDLLWVYEGLTDYYGVVLAARSGAWSAEDFRQYLAWLAATLDHVPGRTWRALQDTADEAPILYDVPAAWRSWRRATDFYEEGELLWLDVDTKIRELSHDQRSLDDFAKLFCGVQNGSIGVLGYDFADVVAALNRVQRFDWASLLRERLDSHVAHAPLEGVGRAGWRLVYHTTPDSYFADREKVRKVVDLTESLGVRISEQPERGGQLTEVIWEGPAFRAGLAPGMSIVAVNGEAYTPQVLKEAIAAASHSTAPIELLVRNADAFWTAHVDYHEGPQYPHLERIEGTPDRLESIIRAR